MATNDNPPGCDSDAAESPEGSGTATFSERLERYSAARARAIVMLDHLRSAARIDQDTPETEMTRGAAAKLSRCGDYLGFRNYFTVGETRLTEANFCKQHLLCPLCAIRRGSKALKAYLDRFEVVQERRKALRPFLVTFTVTNGPDLSERFTHLQKSLKRLHKQRRQHLADGGRAAWTEAARAQGAVWSYEVTNRGKGWHPHVHAIWLCDQEPDMYALRSEWEAITGDSFMVDVRPMTEDETGFASSFMEVFKYAVKFSDLDPADTLHAWQNLRGRRLLGSFGCFRGVQVPEALEDELLDDLPFVWLLYRYQRGDYHLHQVHRYEDGHADGQVSGQTSGHGSDAAVSRARIPAA